MMGSHPHRWAGQPGPVDAAVAWVRAWPARRRRVRLLTDLDAEAHVAWAESLARASRRDRVRKMFDTSPAWQGGRINDRSTP